MNMHLIILAEIGISSLLWFGTMVLNLMTDFAYIKHSQERMLSKYRTPEQFYHYLRYLNSIKHEH